MILLLRIVAAFFISYLLYQVYEWIMNNYSRQIICPNCDGEGKWETMREVETCLLCKGKGTIERVVED